MRARSLLFAFAATAVVATAAIAETTFNGPKEISVQVRAGTILSSSSRNTSPDVVLADIDARLECPSGLRIFAADVVNTRDALAYYQGPGHNNADWISWWMGSTERVIESKTFERIPVVTAAALMQACGDRPAAVVDVPITVRVTCDPKDKSDKLGRKMREVEQLVRVAVACDRNYKATTFKPVQWEHACPEGWVVSGSGDQRTVERNTDRPLPCVRKGSAAGQQGPKG